METIKYVIKDQEGIHARPAGIIVQTAKKFASTITIRNKGKEADLKRIFGVMGLCVKSGEEIEISASGPDEKEAIREIESALKANL